MHPRAAHQRQIEAESRMLAAAKGMGEKQKALPEELLSELVGNVENVHHKDPNAKRVLREEALADLIEAVADPKAYVEKLKAAEAERQRLIDEAEAEQQRIEAEARRADIERQIGAMDEDALRAFAEKADVKLGKLKDLDKIREKILDELAAVEEVEEPEDDETDEVESEGEEAEEVEEAEDEAE